MISNKLEDGKTSANEEIAKIAACSARTLIKSKGVVRLHQVLGTDAHCKGEEKVKHISMNSAMNELSVSDVLMSGDITDLCVLKFWLLLLGGVMVFFMWLVLFSWCAKVWGPNAHFENALTAAISMNMTESANDTSGSGDLFYVDIWFALALMAAIDAFAIVINFNRSLIHQFHYFVSLRMMLLAFIISAAVHLLHGNKHSTPHPAVVLSLCYIFYILSIFVLEKLHKVLPVRGIGESRGSLQKFSEQVCLFDLPWKCALIIAATNGAVGLLLTALVPAKWSVLNPVVHITWEVTFLGLMGTKQTPRYIWFATPIVQASTCTDWGLRQVVVAPSLVVAPWAFLALMLAGRLMLDIHLRTVYCHRRDFQWARKEILFPTKYLFAFFAGILLIEYMGMPVVTFIKPMAVVILHAFGVLVFLLPASHALAFDKIRTIRN